MKSDLRELLEKSKKYMNSLSEEERKEIFRKQGESWSKAEIEWAKDFREGKCERD